MLPEWAERRASEDEMVPYQQALTKDGRRIGNAMITEMGLNNNELYITLVTDAGNRINKLTRNEFDELFYLGEFVMKNFVNSKAAIASMSR